MIFLYVKPGVLVGMGNSSRNIIRMGMTTGGEVGFHRQIFVCFGSDNHAAVQ